ncbi:G-type lectin S-receptor-like serine/threonine-protein kinase [Actinidia chinensis var. chinensis]|uniref:G-type lectin S-receptor-like serine/threonine-protein kinase n=1 Tax=Actinidia chinensis var. chinensis TaxID=1590841 RepID=A0A2R6P5R3_ACTCC|nr:G-type lectin S-receptor-like serine/threonine-protein kinase [Actinidia chinensis var. chinensis]
MNGTQCNVVIVNCDEKIVAHNNLPLKDAAETSVVQLHKHFPKSTNPDKQKNLAEESHFDYLSSSSQIQYVPFPPLTSTSKEFGESSNKSKSPRKNGELTSTVNLGTRMPLQLSWEMVEEITCGFTRCVDETKSFKLYCGYLSDHHSQVLVKRFSSGQFDDVLEAEKKAASSMYHKNILGLIGYHKSDYATVLVHPFSRQGTLDKYLHGSKGRQVKLTFQEKIDTAIRIGQGVRYMHEECPRGPIVHRDLRPCNILMKADLEPLITGFGKAKWLQLDRVSPISSNRFRLKNPSDIEALALVKSDIFQFGILLLRLFCRRFAPQNDGIFLEWARPLLTQMAYHKLLEEDVEYLDTYGVMRVMWAAAQCIEPRPILRPNISEVISLLKGETSCAVPSSPSSEGSPNVDLCAFNLSPYRVVNTVKEYS